MRTCVIIPARGGSERLKDKNIFPINGRPMIQYAIDAACGCEYVEEPSDVYVSSDSDKILEMVKLANPKISMIGRPSWLGTSTTPKQAVVDHAVKEIKKSLTKEYDAVVSLQPNSPQILSSHLNDAIKAFKDNDRWEVFSVDRNLMQNAVFRVISYDHPYLHTLSTNCGVVVCDIEDVHTKEEAEMVEWFLSKDFARERFKIQHPRKMGGVQRY